MALLQRHTQFAHPKGPSFSSSLLESIYHSINENGNSKEQQVKEFVVHRRNNAAQVEEDIESLRRAIMIDKWMENYSTSRTRSIPNHFPSNSGSPTDSSIFSSSETDSSASKSTPKLSLFQVQKSMKKSRAQKIYGDLKKVTEPLSPGGKITNFLNSIFRPRNLSKHQGMEKWSSMRKSRSMKDTTNTTTTCPLASKSCLSKNPSYRGSNSKRAVRFCTINAILDEDCQPSCHKSIYDDGDEYSISPSVPPIGSQFMKKNMDNFRDDLDNMSCASSDLFELENVGWVGTGAHEELPVYGTTRLQRNLGL